MDDWFEKLPPDQRKPLLVLRKIIVDSAADVKEEMKWNRPCYSIKGLVCYLHKSKSHVTIGFYQGAHLADPNALLEGEGKDMRHIKIHSGDKINISAIKALVRNAIELDGS